MLEEVNKEWIVCLGTPSHKERNTSFSRAGLAPLPRMDSACSFLALLWDGIPLAG